MGFNNTYKYNFPSIASSVDFRLEKESAFGSLKLHNVYTYCANPRLHILVIAAFIKIYTFKQFLQIQLDEIGVWRNRDFLH